MQLFLCKNCMSFLETFAYFMNFEYRSLCCHVSVAVSIVCISEIALILLSYSTNIEHPLMSCQSYNVSIPRPFSSSPTLTAHRLCTTSGPLLMWIIGHLFTDILALIAIHTSRHRALIPCLFVTVMDLLASSAYIVVLFVQIILGEHIDKKLLMFIIALMLFKSYDVCCGRQLFWFLQSQFDSRYTPRSTLVKDDSIFQF
uniref:G_PROTEIN_RECEP_F1_2 domain-containing protein n=1 Tax=Heterorhabditis bacteriophora TaxID=37862 RepID=A0A1I7XLM9_HETBA